MESIQFAQANQDLYPTTKVVGFTSICNKLECPTKVKLVFHKSGKDALPIPNTTKGKNELLGYIMLENKKPYQENNRPYYPWYVEQYKKFLNQRSSNTV